MAQTASQSLAAALSGLSFRNNLNTILAALFSGSSGPAAPSPSVQFQLWGDTGVSPPVLRFRNTANTAWIAAFPETIPANTLRGNPTGAAAAEQEVTMTQLRTMLGYSQALNANNGYILFPGAAGLQVGLQWGSVVGTTNGSGQLPVTFPIAFPTQTRLVVCNNGDNAPSSGGAPLHSSITTTGFTAVTTALSVSIRLNYIAIGN